MGRPVGVPSRPSSAALAVMLSLVVGCDVPTDPTLDAPAIDPGASPGVILETGAGDYGAGDRLVLSLTRTAETPGVEPVAVSGVLSWDARRYRWVGQIPLSGAPVLVNTTEVERGQLRFAGYAARGSRRMSPFVLEALDSKPVADIEASFLFAGDGAAVEIGPLRASTTGTAMPDASAARDIGLGEWIALEMPDHDVAGDEEAGPRRVPGEGVIFGDATLDGVIDARDALYVSNMSVSNTFFAECMLGTDVRRRDCIAANVAPANPPGLGEADDPCPPGLEACDGFDRFVDARDVREISREAVGIDQPIPGQPIPRPTVLASDTVPLVSVTGTRVLDPDTIYRISGVVEVGVDGAGGASGELVILPGVRVLASVDAALVVGRNGRIDAQGTAFQPIVFDCDGQPFAGCWRGIRIHGNALVNGGSSGTSPATPRSPGGCREGFGPSGEGLFGGCSDADDSGALAFVRILNGGATSGGGFELRGVGSGTMIRQVYVTDSASDGMVVLGGTVGLREIRIQSPGIRGFAWDQGWRGTLQHMAVQAGNATRVAMEGSSSDVAGASPNSNPVLRNVTLVSGPDAAGSPKLSGGIRLRGGTRGSLRSFLLVGQPEPTAYALDIDGSETWSHALLGDLSLDSSVIAGYGQLGEQDGDPQGLGTLYSTDAEGQYLRRPHLGNRIVHQFDLQDRVLRGAFASVPDLRPVPFGVVSTTLCGAGAPLDPAPYCGALPPTDLTLSEIPWLEPGPLVGTVATPVTPTPGYAIIVVQGVRDGEDPFPLQGITLGSGVMGATDADGIYRTYIGAEPDGSASGFILSLGNLPPSCPDPGLIINLGPPSAEEQVYGVPVPCN